MSAELLQPIINIGILGHVANGKSSLIRAITGEKTARGDSRCMQKGESREMTIQIGYSNAKIYQCDNCPTPECFSSIEGSKTQIPDCDNCGQNTAMKLVKFVSFVDAPGHRNLMRNMISGSAVMDCAILVVDANKGVQIQTLEHLTAAEIIGIDKYIAIAQNKIDLVLNDPNREDLLLENFNIIKELVEDTGADLSRTPVIPTCFSPARQIGLKLLLQCIVERAQPKNRPAYQKFPLFIHCVRSFDVNKPSPANNLKGGVIGGTIMSGILKIGDTLEILPGYKTNDGQYKPLYTKVTSLFTGNVPILEAYPGGLIGIGTTLDPTFTRGDAMVGMCAGYKDQLPDVTTMLTVRVYLLQQCIGHDKEVRANIGKLHTGDIVQLAVGASSVNAKLIRRNKKDYIFETTSPICHVHGQSIPISKIIDGAWTIIGKAQTVESDTKPLTFTETVQPVQSLTYQELLTLTLQENRPLPVIGSHTLPSPILLKEGSIKLVWTNFDETCKILSREKAHLQTFFHEELSARITLNGAQHMVIHGKNRFQTRHLQNILVKYINTFVKCSCQSVNTTLTRPTGSKYSILQCKNCGAEHLK